MPGDWWNSLLELSGFEKSYEIACMFTKEKGFFKLLFQWMQCHSLRTCSSAPWQSLYARRLLKQPAGVVWLSEVILNCLYALKKRERKRRVLFRQLALRWIRCCSLSTRSSAPWQSLYARRFMKQPVAVVWLWEVVSCLKFTVKNSDSDQSVRCVIKRSLVRVPAGVVGECSSPGSAFCADSYFSSCCTPMLPQ